MRKINNIYSCIVGIIAMLIIAGCNNFLDEATQNPNSLTEVPIAQRISPLEGGYAFQLFGGMPARISSNWTQQITYNGDNYYFKLDVYQLGEPWDPFNGIWTFAYSNEAKNAKFTYEDANKKGYPHVEGIAKVMFVWTMVDMTNWFGPVPFSEAFDPTINFPKFDKQSKIYPKLLDILNSAIKNLNDNGKLDLSDNDLIYKGDMLKWNRLAYTLKARFLMQLTEAPDNKKKERATEALKALTKGFKSNEDNAVLHYSDSNNSRNPWNIIPKYPRLQNIQMSAHYVKLLKSLDDPRLPIQANVAVKHEPGKKYIGNRNGAPDMAIDSVSDIGSAYTAADAPGRLLTYSDAKFLEAQAKLITQGPAAADKSYKEGIRANMEMLGVSDLKIDKYINKREDLSVSNNPLEDIMVQKYINNFLDPQAYNDWRKTGYPKLRASYKSESITPNFSAPPRRFAWPNTIIVNNKKSVESLGIPLNYDVMKIPNWWDTRGSKPINK